eukprot:Rhum_TRINITY_DN13759_c4_g1::Rhum_TRINITY_DN13759_c4_g1_i1::g.64073::m.64073
MPQPPRSGSAVSEMVFPDGAPSADEAVAVEVAPATAVPPPPLGGARDVERPNPAPLVDFGVALGPGAALSPVEDAATPVRSGGGGGGGGAQQRGGYALYPATPPSSSNIMDAVRSSVRREFQYPMHTQEF